MSGLLGIVSCGDRLPSDRELHPMLNALRRRGADRLEVRREDDALFAVVRHEWEMAEGLSGPTLLAVDADLVVAADAALYEAAALRERLRSAGVVTSGSAPADLILGAYRAWGEAALQRLNGDFAFLVWNRRTRTLLCCRDWVGTRPLHFAALPGALVVASTLGAVRAHAAVGASLNLAAVAAAAGGLFAADHETCYAAVSQLLAGHTLRWEQGRQRVERYWVPPPDRRDGASSFAEGAAELRGLLRAACAARMPASAPSSVWLSGGYDSAALFAASADVVRADGERPPVRAVSISYPPGDPGREDELIRSVAEPWDEDVHWIDIGGIPLLEQPERRAADRDEPFAHTFEMWNRALARGSRERGARVAFAGAGGDALFSLSPIYLADLLQRGRWLTLLREWRGGGLRGSGARSLLRWTLIPLLGPAVRRAAAALRGGAPLRGYMDRTLPPWIDAAFARRHSLLEREARFTPAREGKGHAAHEMHWFLLHPFAARIASAVFALSLDEGVEMRLPFYDQRVVEFAAWRPWWERHSRGDTKRLLRAAMRGLLPEPFLQPRHTRTGTTGAYLRRSLQGAHADVLRRAFAAPALAEAGIVDAAALRQHCERYLRGDGADGATELQLFFTLQAELWLRAQAA
jgi:asparagine synthase (glutamine-hydrolysing)